MLIGLRSDFVPSGPVEKYKGGVAKTGQRAGGHKIQDCQAPAHKWSPLGPKPGGPKSFVTKGAVVMNDLGGKRGPKPRGTA